MPVSPEKRSNAGLARAAKLSPERRSQIASTAALTRQGVQRATHKGILRLGDLEIECYVLAGGKRVLSQGGLLRAIGRNKPRGGAREGDDQTPSFLGANNLKSLISKEILPSTMLLRFLTPEGALAHCYSAELLPHVCNLYLTARTNGVLLAHQMHIAERCELLVRALAVVGITALVDEATGYQETREQKALQAILDKYLMKEYAAWAKRFPDEFFKHIFRLRGWPMPTDGNKKPSVVGKYINDIVYSRLAPELVEELKRRNPAGHVRHHQWLTRDIGDPALQQHVHTATALMRISTSWEQFTDMLDMALPKKNSIDVTIDAPISRA